LRTRKKKSQTKDTQTQLALTERKPKPLVATVDYEKYLHHLEDSSASDEEKIVYIRMLADILVRFVDLGFGVDPVQQASKACGKDREEPHKTALTAANEVFLDHKLLIENFKSAADLETESAEEGIPS